MCSFDHLGSIIFESVQFHMAVGWFKSSLVLLVWCLGPNPGSRPRITPGRTWRILNGAGDQPASATCKARALPAVLCCQTSKGYLGFVFSSLCGKENPGSSAVVPRATCGGLEWVACAGPAQSRLLALGREGRIAASWLHAGLLGPG